MPAKIANPLRTVYADPALPAVAEEDAFGGGDAVATDHTLAHCLAGDSDFDAEADCFQALDEVGAVEPQVIVLTKAAFAFAGIGQVRVFVGSLQAVHRYGDDGNAAGLQHAVEFAHRLPIIDDVFEHMVAEDAVGALVGKCQVHNIAT